MPRFAALAPLLALLLATPAGAAIVPQRGMAKIRLGMTVKEVNRARGVPDNNATRPNDLFGHTRTYTYGTVKVLFDGTRPTATVILVETSRAGERTRAGIGVGSTRRSVARSVPGVACHVDKRSGQTRCYVGEYKANRRITEFRIGRSGRVSRIRIGIVFERPRVSA